jgi:cation-transporting ATPase 13A3/4/5
LSIGSSFALSRLKKKSIFCISPQKINVAGRVNIMCFDKTGTLTDEGLSVHGFRVISVKSEKLVTFRKLKMSVKELHVEGMYTSTEEYEEKKGHASVLFIEALASCHSLTKVNGKLIGDPLDIEMFSASGWILDEPDADAGDPNELISTFVMPNTQQQDFDWSTFRRRDSPYPYQLGIVRRFEFTSKLQRMSVLVQNLRELKYRVYTKGAPEKMRELCRISSLPNNYSEVLARYTKKGFRVLAIGTRELNLNYIQAQKVTREAIENKLIFIGFLILKNKLKPTATSVITELHSASIKTIMLTGDNPYTAISVAKECGLMPINDSVILGEHTDDLCGKRVTWTEVSSTKKSKKAKKTKQKAKNYSVRLSSRKSSSSESGIDEFIPRQMTDSLELETERVTRTFPMGIAKQSKDDIEDLIIPIDNKNTSYAITGKAIDFILKKDPLCNRSKTKKLLGSTSVYTRMSPESKARLVEALEKLGNIVGMCGDGANDCAALKAADIGISLSDAEASIAAPFTSRTPDIKCVIKLLREGRAALSTSFQCFKYMTLYSVIQFVSVSILYSLKLNLTDTQYLVIDLLILLPLAVTMSWTKAARGLSKKMPTSDLLSISVLASILGQALIQCVFQVFTFITLDLVLSIYHTAKLVLATYI